MPVKPPTRWTARSLTVKFLPHMFRNARNHAEAIGPVKEKVPLDAHENHLYIKRKEEKMIKAMSHDFKLNLEKPKDTPKGYIWSITTGEWVPPHSLKLHCIFPFALGPMVAQQVSSRIHFRGAYNGMLLPHVVAQAFTDWTLAVAPLESCRYEQTPKSYLFRILDLGAQSLRKPVYPGASLTVGDLDRQQLHFRSNATLNPHSCYFHSCLAVWKLTFLEQPDRSAEEFWERFQYKMDGLWGSLKDRQEILDIFKPPELIKSEEIDEGMAKVEDVPSSVDDEPAVGQTQEEQSEQTKRTTGLEASF